MPRPKRTKIAPSIPSNRSAKLNSRLINPKDVANISDDEEGQETGIRSLRRFRDRNEHSMMDNPPTTHNTRLNDSKDGLALKGMKKRRDAAMRRLEAENNTTMEQSALSNEQVSSSPVVELGRRAVATPNAENSLLAFGNFRRRTRQPSILGRKDRARSSSVESNLAESNAPVDFPVEGSARAKGMFKRRQRQPSILGRGTSRVRSSSVELEMDKNTPGDVGSAARPGMHKRKRSRQPSILGTGRKGQERRFESDYDDEDDFNPDDESTPLNLSKIRSTSLQGPQSMSSASNPYKRKLSSLQPARSSPPIPADDEAQPSSNASIRNSPEPTTGGLTRPGTPEPLSDTMAPPRSSSSLTHNSPEVLLPSRRTNIEPRGRPVKRQPARRHLAPPREESLPSSPPSLTHSPNRPQSPVRRGRAATGPRNHPANLSTVELQALLPRRRRRQARDPFDIESSDDGEIDPGGLGSDDDELTHLTTRSTRSRSVARLKPGPNVQSKSTRSQAARASASASASKPARPRRAAAAAASDKENDSDGLDPDDDEEEDPDDPDDSLAPVRDPAPPEDSQELEARVGRELKTAKRKFELVDRWELEFEDVTAGSSSPWDDAR